MEVWEQKTVKRERIATKEADYPFPVIPVGTKYHFGNNPFVVIDSIVKHETVQMPVSPSSKEEAEDLNFVNKEWIDQQVHIIVVQ